MQLKQRIKRLAAFLLALSMALAACLGARGQKPLRLLT